MHDEPYVIRNNTLAEVISGLPNDLGIVLDHSEGSFMYIKNLNPERLAEWDADENLFHVVCMAARDIFSTWSEHVEKTYFPPLTPENDLFKLGWYRWQDTMFCIVQVPIDKRHLLFIAADDVKMRLADGTPHMIAGGAASSVMSPPRSGSPFSDFLKTVGIPAGSVSVFPLNSCRTYTLEPVYAERGAKLAGIGAFNAAPVYAPKVPTVIDEMLERFQRRKKNHGRGRDR